MALIGAAVSAAPAVLVARQPDRCRWKRLDPGGIWIPNPEYYNAPYEIKFLWEPEMKMILAPSGSLSIVSEVSEMYPLRFKDVTTLYPVYPFIQT